MARGPEPRSASRCESHPAIARVCRTAGGTDLRYTSPRRTASSCCHRVRTLVAAELTYVTRERSMLTDRTPSRSRSSRVWERCSAHSHTLEDLLREEIGRAH